jgi:hypothetical protein
MLLLPLALCAASGLALYLWAVRPVLRALGVV